MDRLDAFLLGTIVAFSLVAGMFFLRYWKETRDSFFLSFSLAFLINGLSRGLSLWLAHPNKGSIPIYLLRLLSYGLILAAIIRKNAARP